MRKLFVLWVMMALVSACNADVVLIDDFTGGKQASADFTISREYINLLVGVSSDKDYADNLSVNLLVDGELVRSVTPFDADSDELSWTSWNVREFVGRNARIVTEINKPFFRYSGGTLKVGRIEMGKRPRSTFIGDHTQVLEAKQNLLLIPAEDKGRISSISVVVDGENILGERQIINIAENKIDYYVPIDISGHKGKSVEVSFTNMDENYLVFNAVKQADSYEYDMNEPYRPVYHFAPDYGWTNDPNGMVYSDGEYHIAYQANPYGVRHFNMHWGNAVSRDLVHWTNLPFIVAPDSLGAIFSGSSVEDTYNSSGFGKKALVGMFTSAGLEQSQSLAYSTDGGHTYTKYENNPVISDPERPDFRDPKMFRYGDKWIVAIAAGEVIAFYESDNLTDWVKISEFGKGIGSHAAVWECPDLIPLEYEGKTKWVLLVSINPGGPNGGSVTQYFIGDFDGKQFTADPLPYPLWLDEGMDNYAGVTFANTADRHIFLGWMSNWLYTNDVPTKFFRNAMTIARDLFLKHNGKHLFLASVPSPEIEAARGEKTLIRSSGTDVLPRSGAYEINFVITPEKNQKMSLRLYNELSEEMVFDFDFETLILSLDRSRSGKVDFNENFAKSDIKTMLVEREQYKVRLFVDKHSTELFINDGDLSFTNTMFPTMPYTSLEIKTDNGNSNISELVIYELI